LDEHGSTAAAISVAGSVSQVTEENMKRLVAVLKRASEEISAALSEEPRS